MESALKASQYVDNICVYGGALSNDLVALITPNRKSFNTLAMKLEKKSLEVQRLCDDPDMEIIVQQDIQAVGKVAGLGKKELPVRIRLVSEEWSPDNGILTAALKLKRKAIENFYHNELDELYKGRPKKIVTTTTLPVDGDSNNNNNHARNNGNTNGQTELTTGTRDKGLMAEFDMNNDKNNNNILNSDSNNNVDSKHSSIDSLEINKNNISYDVKPFANNIALHHHAGDIPASIQVQ